VTTALVTGATGFVGRQALCRLAEAGVEVHGVTRRSSAPGLHAPGVEWHQADLLQPGQAERLIGRIRPSHLLHAAWCVEHGRFWNDPANIDWLAASCRLLRLFAEAGGRRFLGVGTCAEYAPQDAPCDERDSPLAPVSLYGVAKHAFHLALAAFAGTTGLSHAWARLFFLVGPHEKSQRLVPDVALHLLRGEAVPCSSGRQVRDAGAALARLLLSPVEGAVNIARGNAVPISMLACRLGEIAGQPQLVRLGARPNRPGEPLVQAARVDRLRDEVGFAPRYELDEMLADALDWWRAQSPE